MFDDLEFLNLSLVASKFFSFFMLDMISVAYKNDEWPKQTGEQVFS